MNRTTYKLDRLNEDNARLLAQSPDYVKEAYSRSEHTHNSIIARLDSRITEAQNSPNLSSRLDKIDLAKEKLEILGDFILRTRAMIRGPDVVPIYSDEALAQSRIDMFAGIVRTDIATCANLASEHRSNVQRGIELQNALNANSSLVEDFADPSTEMPSYTEPED